MKGHYAITNYPPHGVKVVALGDSLTEGVGATSKERGYIANLDKRLNIEIANSGLRGNTTHDALLRLDKDVLALKPTIVLILLGGNDALLQIPVAQTFANIELIIRQTQKTGAVVQIGRAHV